MTFYDSTKLSLVSMVIQQDSFQRLGSDFIDLSGGRAAKVLSTQFSTVKFLDKKNPLQQSRGLDCDNGFIITF